MFLVGGGNCQWTTTSVREFQVVGPATEKVREPYMDLLWRGTTTRWRLADRSWLYVRLATGVQNSIRQVPRSWVTDEGSGTFVWLLHKARGHDRVLALNHWHNERGKSLLYLHTTLYFTSALYYDWLLKDKNIVDSVTFYSNLHSAN